MTFATHLLALCTVFAAAHVPAQTVVDLTQWQTPIKNQAARCFRRRSARTRLTDPTHWRSVVRTLGTGIGNGVGVTGARIAAGTACRASCWPQIAEWRTADRPPATDSCCT
jgi:hypothetical protein